MNDDDYGEDDFEMIVMTIKVNYLSIYVLHVHHIICPPTVYSIFYIAPINQEREEFDGRTGMFQV